jgi:hypothetical protein
MNPFTENKIVEHSTRSLRELIGTFWEYYDFEVNISLGNIQRNESWKESATQLGLDPYTYHKALINSIFDNVDIGVITLEESSYTSDFKVIDGKHRLKAIKSFLENEFSVNRFGVELFWNDILQLYQREFTGKTIQVSFTKKGLTELELCELFLAKNNISVPQSEEHLEKIKDWVSKLSQ